MALFGRVITKEIVSNKENLAEEIYIFLNTFVNSKIRYESREEKEDCIQDTAMHILQRFEELNIESLEEDFNYEKFLYNRANSYVSYWLRKLVKERKNLKDYMKDLYHLQEGYEEKESNRIDIKELQTIILEYNLGNKENLNLLSISVNKLIEVGFYGTIREVENLGNINKSLESLAFAVIDEYLYKVYGKEEE